MVIIFPVDSSAPAKITRVRAIPKTTPWTSFVQGLAAALSGPAAMIMSTTATPI